MHIDKRALVVLGVLTAFALLLTVAACGNQNGGYGGSSTGTTGDATAGPSTIRESNNRFSPDTIEVAAGDTINFVNEDSVAHEVEIDGENLGRQEAGETVSWSASKAGTYEVICKIHPSMKATITVK